MAKNIWIICGILIVALLLGVAAVAPRGDLKSDAPAVVMTGARLDVPFSLINQDGKTVTDRDVAGKYRLMFFGFTFCPAVCPTELQKIAETLAALGDDAQKITPVFVTVDPERDTPDVLKKYLSSFDPRLIGLTGSVADIRKMADGYKVYFKKMGEGPHYMMDHSAFTYLLSPEGDLLTLYRPDQTVSQIVSDLRARLRP